MISAQSANRHYFREAYRTGEHGWAVEEPSPYAVRFLRRVVRVVPGGTLLDVGCGEGRHAIAAAWLGFRVTGVDYEPLALRRARRFATIKQAKGIVFRRADALSLPFAASRFDVVLDYGCLHHQRKSDWPAYMSGVLRVLKPGGFYILSVFGPGFHLLRDSQRPWHIAQGAYRRRFAKDDILALFGRSMDVLAVTKEKGKQTKFWHALMRRRTGAPGPFASRRPTWSRRQQS